MFQLMIELREKQFPALWYTLYQHILEMFLLVLYIFNSTKILPSRTHSCLHFMAGQKETNKNMHTWIIATLSLKVILMMTSCNNEIKFYIFMSDCAVNGNSLIFMWLFCGQSCHWLDSHIEWVVVHVVLQFISRW